MQYDTEQFQQAIHLALRVAREEIRLEQGKDLEQAVFGAVPRTELTDHLREELGQAHGDFINEPLAELLLPKARIIAKMEKERYSALASTDLGKLAFFVFDLLGAETQQRDLKWSQEPFASL